MSIALGRDGVVFLAMRSDILRLRDSKSSGQADERKVIVKLDSPGDYPHNGLAGFAFDGLGDMYFSLGENLGAPYKLIGSDGSTQSGGGEGGSIYRCRPDGSEAVARRHRVLEHLPSHSSTPSAGCSPSTTTPTCAGRAGCLHVVPGGDYGYRFRNGRAWPASLHGVERRAARHPAHGRRHRRGAERHPGV